MRFSLRVDNMGNRKATVKRDLAVKDIRGWILFPSRDIERTRQYVAIDAATRPSTRAPTINDACGKGESARIEGHEKSLNFAFNKLPV